MFPSSMERQMENEIHTGYLSLEAQLPIYWVPVLKSLYSFLLSVTQGPTIWAPGLIGFGGYR